MSNLNPASSLSPLSVGNVVSAGVRIYRSHLKQYFSVALLAYAWLIVPIYGWAKYAAINASISRHAYSELIDQPETLTQVRVATNAKLWRFLVAGILVSLIFLGLYLAFGIVAAILIGFGTAVSVQNPGGYVGMIGLGLILLIVAIVIAIRVYSRLSIVEVPLAIEEGLDASGAIGRSWSLTKDAVGRIQWIILVAFLLTLIVSIPTQIITSLLQLALGVTDDSQGAASAFISLVSFTISILTGALILPFWQVIKAVLYYDLRARREGLGLQLRDR
jgi:hypothetical protein